MLSCSVNKIKVNLFPPTRFNIGFVPDHSEAKKLHNRPLALYSSQSNQLELRLENTMGGLKIVSCYSKANPHGYPVNNNLSPSNLKMYHSSL